MAPHSCSRGSMGKDEPVSRLTSALNSSTRLRRSSSESSASVAAPVVRRRAERRFSKCPPGTPSTTSPYICRKRRYESYANRALPLCLASPSTVRSFIPRFRMVSIMPGIEMAAPERTDTSNGLAGSPNCLPVVSSSCLTFAETSSRSEWEMEPSPRYVTQHWADMVNPGGTGTPRFVISARFAPLPPSTDFISRVPSARPFPKKYTDFAGINDSLLEAGHSIVYPLIRTTHPGITGAPAWLPVQQPQPNRNLFGSAGGGVG